MFTVFEKTVNQAHWETPGNKQDRERDRDRHGRSHRERHRDDVYGQFLASFYVFP